MIPELTSKAVLDASPIPTSVVDSNGTIVYVNDAFLAYASKMWGKKIEREERIGRNVQEFMVPHRRDIWLEVYDRVLNKGEEVFLREFRCGPPGREMYVDVRMNPIKDEGGQVIGAVLTWQDVSERVREQKERHIRAALDRVRVSVYKMRESEDIKKVLVSLYEALKDVGVDFDDCSVQIVNEEKGIFESYFVISGRMDVNVKRFPLKDNAVYEAWRDKRPIYREDLDEEDKYGERMAIRKSSGKPIRSVLDMPFSHGTIAINSVRPGAFSEDVLGTLGQFAEVFSEAYTRFEDIRRVEESERKYRSILEHSQDVIFRLDLEGNYLFISPVVEQLGYTPEEFYSDRTIWRRIVLPDDFKKVGEGFRKAVLGEISRNVEYRIRTKDGKVLWVSQNTYPVRDSQGRVVAVEGTVRDITEHKQAEEALRESEARFRMVTEKSLAGIYIIQDGKFRYVNPTLAHIFGYTPEEIVDRLGPLDLTHPDDRPLIAENIRRRLEGELESIHYIFRGLRKGGEVINCETLGRRVEYRGRPAIIGTLLDITERVRAEEALRESEEKYRNLFENARDVIVTFDLEGNITSVNKAVEEYGFKESELLGRNMLEFVSNKYHSRLLKELAEVAQGIPNEGEIEVTTPKGEKIVEYRSNPIRKGDKVVGVQTILRDITERKQAEEMLIQATQQWQATFDAIGDMVAIIDEGYRVVRANKAMKEAFGSVLGAHCYELFHGTDGPIPDCPAYRAFRSGEASHLELQEGHLGGRWFDFFAYPIKDEDGKVYQVVHIARDITQRRETQQMIQQQDRLAAVGRLAAGIAHDFNNLLSVIIGYAQILEMREDIPESAKRELKTIERQGLRAVHLIRQILDFSRKSVIQRKPLDLVPFLKETVKFLKRTIPESIEIVLEMDPGKYIVNADPAQIQQMLANLAVNARDAMPEGGELGFQLSRLSLRPEDEAPFPDMQPGEWIVLSVWDTGVGIPPEILPRIFEPFFTTKEAGKGSGLGLAQVYGIVKQHDGFIGVESRVGEGTKFTIYLPFSGEAEGELEEEVPEEVPHGRGETILVVEDEPAVLFMIGEVLEGLGYRVLKVGSGREALRVYEQHREEIALVLTDLVMPEMGGMRLYQALRELNPEVKVVVMTGYSSEKEIKELLSQGIVTWVQKPIDITKLAKLMKEVLR
ncbi:MAG: hypothetical protein DRN95_01930 [Candidatus Hydrothermarchaeota archaeon]|nr:MAG: hypothetical protein DRN95_01930 [Candidatus Hydrothermarchaeota archaeon]